MPNQQQESLLKETNDLLESAQKEVLNEINTKRNLFQRLFAGKSSESLKQAQSSISKAINQMKGLGGGESGVISKLQSHLNEKSALIKRLEEQFNQSQKESYELKDKLRFYEKEFERLKEEKRRAEQPSIPSDHHRIEDGLREKIKSLEETNREIETRFNASQDSLEESQKLTVELSQRVKRIKAEVTNQN